MAAVGAEAGNGAVQEKAAEELDSVIQAINEVSNLRGRISLSYCHQACMHACGAVSGWTAHYHDEASLRLLSCISTAVVTTAVPSLIPSHFALCVHLCAMFMLLQPQGVYQPQSQAKQQQQQQQAQAQSAGMQQQHSDTASSAVATTAWSDDTAFGAYSPTHITQQGGTQSTSLAAAVTTRAAAVRQPASALVSSPMTGIAAAAEAAAAADTQPEAGPEGHHEEYPAPTEAADELQQEPEASQGLPEELEQESTQQELMRATGAADPAKFAAHSNKVGGLRWSSALLSSLSGVWWYVMVVDVQHKADSSLLLDGSRCTKHPSAYHRYHPI
jgi:hypothetical protein